MDTSSFQFTNFAEVFKKIPFIRFYINSIFVSVVQTVLQIAISAMGAFAFAKLDFPLKNKLYGLYADARPFCS